MTIHRQLDGAPVGRVGRAALVAWAMLLLAGFAFARSLEPDARGFGTHRQLGLPECSFRLLFSRSCPGCGVTTSFSHFVRGEFAAAARANQTGLLLAILFATMVPWCVWSAARGRLILIEEPLNVFAGLTIFLGGIAVVLWVWREWLVK